MKKEIGIGIVLMLLVMSVSAVNAYECEVCGDCNGDGEVNAWDYTLLKSFVLQRPGYSLNCVMESDVNGDGYINAWDYTLLKSFVLQRPGYSLNCHEYVNNGAWDCRGDWRHEGDMNGDGNINYLDMDTLMEYFNSGQTSVIYDDPDVNYNGIFDVEDVIYMYDNYQWTPEAFYPGHINYYRCWKAQYYDTTPLTSNYKIHQFVIYSDYTDENEYIPEVYDCHDFVIDVVEALRSRNVYAHHVYYRYPDGIGAHGLVLIDLPCENPMIIEAQNDENDSDTYDVDSDGIVEYTPEVNYVNDQTPYYYLIYNSSGLVYPAVRMNTDWAWWATDDGNLLADMNYQ